MAFVEAMDGWLAWASLVCCHPVAIFLQLKGCLVYLVLAAGWAYNSVVRARELHRIRAAEAAGNALAFLYPNVDDLEHSAQAKLSRVSVVMPLKGVGEHNLSNWRSQVLSMYGGPLEFLFVVESKEDPAYEVILQLMRDLKEHRELDKIVKSELVSEALKAKATFETSAFNYCNAVSQQNFYRCLVEMGEVDAKLLVAGYSTTCSQKIHNQLAGVDAMHKDSKYVLFLDDDVQLCPGSIGALVAHMIEYPEIFVLTGYPFDLPSGSIGSYCIYEYHLPCSIGFGFGRTFFLWGGCMMMHAEDFRTDRYGMVTGLREGGYSDDMTLAAVAGANQRVISSPERAIFFHPLAKDLSFSRYWNYLQKQTIVLETYNTTYNYWMNRGLFFLHCWASWSFVFPYLTSCVHLMVAMRMLMGASAELYSSWTTGLWLTGCIATATLIELSSMRHLSTVVIALINALSPEKDPVSISSYNYVKVFVAGIVDNFLYPVSAVYSHMFQHIEWAGVQYWLDNGNICQIQRGSRRWRVVESSKSGWSTEEIHGQFPSKSTVWTLLSDLLMNQSSKLKNS